MNLRQQLRDKVKELGVSKAAEYFGVTAQTIMIWTSIKPMPLVDAMEKLLGNGTHGTVNVPPPEMELTMWTGRKLHILLPVYRTFAADTHFTLFANYARYGPEKIAMTIEKRTVIHEARNILTHKARSSDAEWFMMVDDDMILPCGNGGVMNGRYGANLPDPSANANAISRLMSHPPECRIVGALYFGRHPNGIAQCSLGFEDKNANELLRRHVHFQQLIPMRWVGTGLIKIHRSVFDELQKAIDGGKWPEAKPMQEGMPYGFWNPIRTGVGEDVSFGFRCHELGIASFLDPVLECLHLGESMYGSRNTSTPP